MELVPQDAGKRGALLALVAEPRLPHLASADWLERDDDRVPARDCVTDPPGAGVDVPHRMGRAIGSRCEVPPRVEPNHRGRPLRERELVLWHPPRRWCGVRRGAVLHALLV